MRSDWVGAPLCRLYSLDHVHHQVRKVSATTSASGRAPATGTRLPPGNLCHTRRPRRARARGTGDSFSDAEHATVYQRPPVAASATANDGRSLVDGVGHHAASEPRPAPRQAGPDGRRLPRVTPDRLPTSATAAPAPWLSAAGLRRRDGRGARSRERPSARARHGPRTQAQRRRRGP
jgi:hypothetical protein